MKRHMRGLKILDVSIYLFEPLDTTYLALEETWIQRLLELQRDLKCVRKFNVTSHYDPAPRILGVSHFEMRMRNQLSLRKDSV